MLDGRTGRREERWTSVGVESEDSMEVEVTRWGSCVGVEGGGGWGSDSGL
jgi:hypothetical protein